MDLHEFQGKELFRSVGLSTPHGRVAETPDEAAAAAAELGGRVVVKAQVHVGGRGKAGGVKVVKGADATRSAAEEMLGMDIKGHIVYRVLIEAASDIAVSYTHLRAHETKANLVCRLLLEKKKKHKKKKTKT